MNNNVPGAGNAIRNQAGPGAAAGQVQITTTSSPFGSLSPLLALLLASNLNGGGSPYPYYPYYGGYGAYGNHYMDCCMYRMCHCCWQCNEELKLGIETNFGPREFDVGTGAVAGAARISGGISGAASSKIEI
ncbi:unnamed protein product [Cercopithifilaria johnstoni]|uniref:Uncharacterized protein n=1 Tax=Cercopithifilaria johnstoni TaxID=2874296 RepID=A0A8J2QB95_9BILA|nr:unnamed protein product [Cercopithifilaria johnstoni]